MKDKAAVISRIQTLMEFWGITPEDLEAAEATEKTRPAKQSTGQPPVSSAPKYAHPRTGEVWDGQGMQPQWLKDAVLKEGYLVEELRKAALERIHRRQDEESRSVESA